MTKSELYNSIQEIKKITGEMIFFIRRQNFNRGDRLMKQWTPLFSAIVTEVFSDKSYFAGSMASDDMYVMEILQNIMSAQEQKDYICLADSLELGIMPMLDETTSIIAANGDFSVSDYFEKNLQAASYDGNAVGIIRDRYAEINGCDDNFQDAGTGKTYTLETSASGDIVLSIEKHDSKIFMSSKKDPVAEARALADWYYDENIRGYVVFGLGLGYHITALCERTRDNVPIVVYEPDINILVYAFTLTDMSGHMARSLRIIFDSNLSAFAAAVDKSKSSLVMHYPSLLNINNADIRDSFNELFVKDSSVRNQLGDMLSNFHNNIGNCNHYVDELGPEIEGHTVYIAGAGPSLDTNFEELRERSGDSVLIVVGTALRKFVNAGIVPDYAIFLDSSDRIYGQIRGMENGDFRVILASTACSLISERFTGEKYLVCQNGFDEACDFAKEKGYSTYESGGSVATIAFDIALSMKASEIVMLGMDLAYTGNRVHASGANARDIDDTTGLVKVRGVNDDILFTTPAMEIYRKWFEERIKYARLYYKDDCPKLINATGGGAYIEGFEYRDIDIH